MFLDALAQDAGALSVHDGDFMQPRHHGLIVERRHERRAALLALPGGVGTLEELLETLTWRQLGLVKVPVIILNTLGYYDALLSMLSHAIDEGFMKTSHSQLWQVAATPAEAVRLLDENRPVQFESKY